MAKVYFRGDAQGRAQVVKLTPANVEVGDIFTVTINRKDISYTAQDSTVADVCVGLATLIGGFNNEIPEFAEVTAIATDSDGDNEFDCIMIRGLDDGTPFTLTTSTTNGTDFEVSVVTIQEGTPDINEIQRVVLSGPPTGGTFTLTFSGQTTGAIAYNASAATVTSGLEAMSNIAPGDVVVTKVQTGYYLVEFSGAYAATNVPLLSGDGSSLTGAASVAVTVIADGSGGANEIKTITLLPSATYGSNYYYRLFSTYNGNTISTNPRLMNTSAAEMQSMLEQLASVGYGNVTVTRTGNLTDGLVFRVTFTGALANQNIADNFIYDDGQIIIPPGTYVEEDLIAFATVQHGSSSTVNEIQDISLAGVPTGGTFTLTFQGQTTAGIAYNASAATVQTALEALSNIAPGDVTVALSSGIWRVTFGGAYTATDVSRITGNGASLAGSAVYAATQQEAVSGVNETQQFTLVGSPTGGTFTLTFDSETTGAIDFDATASEVQTALEGLATPVPGDFIVTGGPLPDAPVVIEFTGAYAETDVDPITGDASNLTGGGTQSLTKTDITTPTGPHHWNDAENWSAGSLPTTGDTVYIANVATDILYGLDGITDTFAEFHLMASFSGQLGLKPQNESGYFEYRQLSLDLKATKVFIGEGPGGGTAFANINSGSTQTELIVYGTAQPDTVNLPAVLWKGTHSSNVVRIFKGSVGICMLPGEVATVSTLQVGYLNDKDSDVELECGAGITLTTFQGSGGEIALNLETTNVTSFTATSGVITISGSFGVSTTFVIEGDTRVFWNTTGTLGGAPVCADEAYLDFSQDMRTKTITNPIEVYSAESWPSDPFQCVTNLRVDANYSNVLVNNRDLGTNVRLTRGTPS